MAGLKDEDYKRIKDELDTCTRPLYFFHDDSDGLASFLLFYRYKKEGHGIVVKAAPNLDGRFLRKVREYKPDKIFLLDIPLVDQEFLDGCNCQVIWVDHHPLVERQGVKNYNPRKYDENDNTCASELCYHVVEQDLGIATVGIVGDWQLSPVTEEFSKKHPELLPPDITDPGKALFDTKLGKLIRIYEFLLKGETRKVLQSIKILTRVDDPIELLEGNTPRAKYLLKQFNTVNVQYEELLAHAKEMASDDEFLIFTYQENKMSFSGEIANELVHIYPDKVVIVAREKSGEMKTSFRAMKYHLPSAINKALLNVRGYGGGHDNACGGAISADDWDVFIEQLKEALSEQH